MSYCRWSSNGYKCDVYVYESVDGMWVTHIAARKKVGLETLPSDPMIFVGGSDFVERYRAFQDAYDKLEFRDIELPHAGETFHDDSAGECADRLEDLRKLGYYVPQYAIDELREEAAETA